MQNDIYHLLYRFIIHFCVYVPGRFSLFDNKYHDSRSNDDENSNDVNDVRCMTCGLAPQFHVGGHTLVICLICGEVGCKQTCGRDHFINTCHTYAKELGGADNDGDDRIWDYAGGGYVDRLIEGIVDENNPDINNNDGNNYAQQPKIVEMPAVGHDSPFRTTRASELDDVSDMHSKLEGMAAEYVSLLNLELGKQRSHFQRIIDDMQAGFFERQLKKSALSCASVSSSDSSPSRSTKSAAIINSLRGQLKALKAKSALSSEKYERTKNEVSELSSLNESLLRSKKERERAIVKIGVDMYREKAAADTQIKKISEITELLMQSL